jgi:hypothetical protein
MALVRNAYGSEYITNTRRTTRLFDPQNFTAPLAGGRHQHMAPVFITKPYTVYVLIFFI